MPSLPLQAFFGVVRASNRMRLATWALLIHSFWPDTS